MVPWVFVGKFRHPSHTPSSVPQFPGDLMFMAYIIEQDSDEEDEEESEDDEDSAT